MTANGRREPTDRELRCALEILNRPDVDESAADTVLETLMPLSSAAALPRGFSRRVMLAVHQASLAEGRVPLAKPHPHWGAVAALGAAAATIAGGAIAILGPSASPMLVAVVAFMIRTGFSIVASIRLGFQIWNAAATAGTVLGEALALPDVAIVLAATTVVGMLSLTALTQLLSRKQEPSRWHGNFSLFV